MNKEYNKVELTDAELESLNGSMLDDAQPEITESQDSADDTSATEATTEETTEVVTEPAVADKYENIEIDGRSYDAATILKWREDAANKQSWQKSNTEKAQQLSKWNKLSEKINEDDGFRNHLKDFFFDDPEAIKALGLDGDVPILEEETVPELPSIVEQRLKVLEDIEGDRILETRVNHLDDQLTTLEQKFPEYLEGDKVGEFLEFADKNSRQFVDNGIPNLDRAFREWSYAEMQAELSHFKKLGKNDARNEGKVITTAQVGAKEVKTDKKRSSYKDFKATDPDIAKYFDE